MTFELKHPAVENCLYWHELLQDCQSIGKLESRIRRWGNRIKDSDYDASYTDEEGANAGNKFMGDVFEVFCEAMIHWVGTDDRVDILDYHPIIENDTGVDGYGIASDGSPATVQIKFRLWDYQLKHIQDHLNNFRITSYRKFKVDPKAEGRMLILTTAQEGHWKTLNKQFQDKVRCISIGASFGCLKGAQKHTIDSLFSLKSLVDNKPIFWNNFRDQTAH